MATLDEISSAFYNYSYSKYKKEQKNSDKSDEKSFPSKSAFQENFQSNINNVYNTLSKEYPPEQANYIYKTLVSNLEKQSENPGQSRIIDSSNGTINVKNLNSYSKKVEETLKSRHPEKFKVKESSLENKTLTNDIKKAVDFNNPEEKKKYFNNLFDEYSNLKTEEEKEQFKREKFYDYDKNKEVIDLTCDIEVRAAELKKEEPKKTDKECVEQVYEEKAEETGRTKEEIAVDHEFGLLYGEYQKIEDELNGMDENSPEYSEKKKELEETRKRMKQLEKSKEEKQTSKNNKNEKQENDELEDILNANIEAEQETEDLEDILNTDIESEQETEDLEDILNANIESEQETEDLEDILKADIESEQETEDLEDILKADIESEQETEDLEDILNADVEAEQEIEGLEENTTEEETFDISDTLKNVENEQQQENKDVQYNQILGPLGVTELEKEELNSDKNSTQKNALIEYKPNRLKNFINNIINKIKESKLFKKISGKNKNNIVQANNLEQKMKQVNEEKTSFNDSLIVSKEEQEKNKKENENNTIKTEKISLSFGERDGK